MLDAYTAQDMASFCGVSLDQFYRTRQARQRKGMPAPYTDHPMLWHRIAVDCWRRGLKLPQPANDVAPLSAPETIEQHQAFLAQHYARH